MPSFGMLVAIAIVASVLMMSVVNSDIHEIESLHYSENAYKNMQTIQIYRIFIEKYSYSCNETCFAELQNATTLSARMSGVSATYNNCSILLHTLTYPQIFSAMQSNCGK
jgi:type III secretory pathway component EscR